MTLQRTDPAIVTGTRVWESRWGSHVDLHCDIVEGEGVPATLVNGRTRICDKVMLFSATLLALHPPLLRPPMLRVTDASIPASAAAAAVGMRLGALVSMASLSPDILGSTVMAVDEDTTLRGTEPVIHIRLEPEWSWTGDAA